MGWTKTYKKKNILLLLLSLQISGCSGQLKENPVPFTNKNDVTDPSKTVNQKTTFPQIHTNLNGMVREFVRTMHQDRKGTYWFGTNGDGIIRYDGQILEKVNIKGLGSHFRVLDMVEDKTGNMWFGTSEGLIKYDGRAFEIFTEQGRLPNEEIWSLSTDKNGLIWVGTTLGIRHFNGEKFIPFSLPASKVENATPMLSDELVFKVLEDKDGNMWFAVDGNGIYIYKNGAFNQLTAKKELADNHVADIMEDKQGNIWIGTFYGGVSKFDGKRYTHFTKEGIISGEETYNFYEDSKGNVWFTAEGFGVYRQDGKNFTRFTTENGLTTNVVQSIMEDDKGQIWFGTWQGLCIFDGEKFVNAGDKESWTN